MQTIALNVRVPVGSYRLNAASFVTPDGRVNYAGSASTFFYAGDVLGGSSRQVELTFERYIVQGRVVDESGVAVDGAALEIGGSMVFTDSRGRFFLRVSSNRPSSVRVLFDEFLASGRYEIVSAPPTVKPRTERETVPITIVVRRAPSPPTGQSSVSVGRPPEPNESPPDMAR